MKRYYAARQPALMDESSICGWKLVRRQMAEQYVAKRCRRMSGAEKKRIVIVR